MDLELYGKNTLIIGSGCEIVRAIVLAFVSAGADVVIASLPTDETALKRFRTGRVFFKKCKTIYAVNGLNFTIRRQETVSLVGEAVAENPQPERQNYNYTGPPKEMFYIGSKTSQRSAAENYVNITKKARRFCLKKIDRFKISFGHLYL